MKILLKIFLSGYQDVLFIGNQARPKLFDLEIVCPEVLYEEVVEVEERLILQNEKVDLWVKPKIDGKYHDIICHCANTFFNTTTNAEVLYLQVMALDAKRRVVLRLWFTLNL